MSLSLLGHDDNARGGMVTTSSSVVVGAIAGSHRCCHCCCLVNNAGGHRMTVGMGMGVIASSPSTLGMVTGVVIIVVGGHVDNTGHGDGGSHHCHEWPC